MIYVLTYNSSSSARTSHFYACSARQPPARTWPTPFCLTHVLSATTTTAALLGVSCTLSSNTHTGVDSFDISLEKQKVVVQTSSLTPQQVLEAVSKTGKKTTLAQ